MQRLACPTCGNEVFFDSMRCVRCGTELVFDVGVDGALTIGDAAVVGTCLMRDSWRATGDRRRTGSVPSCLIVDAGDARQQHAAGAVPRRPATGAGPAQRARHRLVARRRRRSASSPPLLFTYRSTGAGDPATIGHLGGLITLDLDEADPAQREQIRATLGEQYRTPLGHIRHELGHYVWLRYVAADPARLARVPRRVRRRDRRLSARRSTTTTPAATTAAGATTTSRSTPRPTRGRTSPSRGPR